MDNVIIDLKDRAEVEALHEFISNLTIVEIEPVEAIAPLNKLFHQLGEYLEETTNKS